MPSAVRYWPATCATHAAPPPKEQGGPESWRGQVWRLSAERWGNRGGKRKAEWAAYWRGEGPRPEAQPKTAPEPAGGASRSSNQ